MLTGSLVVAHKELLDHLRDTRSLMSTALYTFMGPLIVALLATSISMDSRVALMAPVFIVVATFTGGMTVAADMIAGERERHSLLPLILNSPSSAELLLGKWLACWMFATVCGLAAALAFMVLILSLPATNTILLPSLLATIPGMIALGALAASLEILCSTLAGNVKEATTYNSILTFVCVAAGMGFTFRASADAWWSLIPPMGQQQLLQLSLAGADHSHTRPIVVALLTASFSMALLVFAVKAFKRNEVDYRTR